MAQQRVEHIVPQDINHRFRVRTPVVTFRNRHWLQSSTPFDIFSLQAPTPSAMPSKVQHACLVHLTSQMHTSIYSVSKHSVEPSDSKTVSICPLPQPQSRPPAPSPISQPSTHPPHTAARHLQPLWRQLRTQRVRHPLQSVFARRVSCQQRRR
jgi:hypothetical protein